MSPRHANSGTFGHGRPGGRPILPIGSRRWSSTRNELLVKVSMRCPYPSSSPRTGWWRSLRVVNWEAVHGPVPKGCCVFRLLPGCDCESNLVLVSRAASIILNGGKWCRPRRPWRSLPADLEIRRTAVLAAVTAAEAGELRRQNNPIVACACGCGATFPKYDGAGHVRRYVHRSHWRNAR